jgi:hypothetical protein
LTTPPALPDHPVEIIVVLLELFRPVRRRETIRSRHETRFRFRADIPKQLLVIKRQRRGGQRCSCGDRQMRTLGLLLTCAFFLVGPSMAGAPDTGLSVGTFAYNGSAVNAVVPLVTQMAAR